ncbi:MAG: hypothetical protein R3E86_11330 [Pseudomonadales bacterium]
MNRSFLTFVLFCLLLASFSALGVWLIGPSVAAIAFDGERRDNPYYVVRLVSAPLGGAQTDVAASIRRTFLELAGNDEGSLLWQSGALDVVQGSVLRQLLHAQLIRFPRGGLLVQMLTSSGYRAMERQLGGLDVQLLGSVETPPQFSPERTQILVLLRLRDPVQSQPLGVPGESGWLGNVPSFGGQTLWQTPITVLRGAGGWNRLLVLEFADEHQARAWLEDPQTVTEQAIAERNLREALIVLAQGAGAFGR